MPTTCRPAPRSFVIPAWEDDGHPGWVTFRSHVAPDGAQVTVQKRDGLTRSIVSRR